MMEKGKKTTEPKMLEKNIRIILLSTVVMFVCACSATAESTSPLRQSSESVPLPTAVPAVISQMANKSEPKGITLEKIMSDTDWIGRQPGSSFWADDGKKIYYNRKQEGSSVSDQWEIDVANSDGSNGDSNGDLVALSDFHLLNKERVYSKDRKKVAWIYENSVFVKSLISGDVKQLTGQLGSSYDVKFTEQGNLIYSDAGSVYLIDLASGLVSEFLRWHFAKKPKALKEPADYIAEEQIKLIDYVASQREKRKQRFERSQQIKQQNSVHNKNVFYFDDSHELVEVNVSPDLSKAILVTIESTDHRSSSDIMPNYIKENGRIKAEEVRSRVADAEPQEHEIWYLDLETQQKHQLSFDTLAGYDEDVLAAVKKENAERNGDIYESEKRPREIQLMVDWYWSQSAIQWNHDGSEVAIMLEAWDNKDRWIATVDWSEKQFQQQHRLHDPAWIAYKFNSFGWFNQSNTLFFLSEESGFANLYTVVPGQKAQNLTPGSFEVDELTVTQDDTFIYYQANIKHPGIYEIYRVNTRTGDSEAITELNGRSSYSLSPAESHLLINHSKLALPPELYLQETTAGATVTRLTHTVSDEFLGFDWVTPQIVPVASNHTQQPIYSRVYMPKVMAGDKQYPAVIFNHGAGYLQNSHLGWSGYFREFMFHSFLVQQGYVVLDMDFRASMGYGRDWRTAIYRQMGTPEIQDLEDGVEWLVENAQVSRENIGTYGGSYGGFMAFMALFTKPDLFQAGAALRPVTDWAHYNTAYTSNILNTPDVDPIAYERSSPIYFAQGLENSLLINAPMVDDNVFFVDVVRLVQRLIELKKENFETAIYPVEPHGFREPTSWLDEYRRIYKLMEENLK